jgi:2-phosphoglycerate kinase
MPDSPVAILIAGGSGTGKSTIAFHVARELDVERLVSTDVLRVAMRAATTPELRPELFRESFQGDSDDVSNFVVQASAIAVAASDVLQYCADQGWSIVMEGVHLVPGLVRPPAGARVHHVLLTVEGEDIHAERFRARARDTSGGRPASVYLENLARIRAIQGHLIAVAGEQGATVIDNSELDEVVAGIVALVR